MFAAKTRSSDLIYMTGLKFYSHIGYFEFEQIEGQNFILDLTYELGRPPATHNDQLEDSVSYAEVYQVISLFMAEARHRLLERAGADLIDTLFEHFPPIQAIDLKISKPDAPIEGQFEAMAYRLYRRRWNQIGIGLGGNQCNSRQALGQAVERLYRDDRFRRQRVSSIYRSPAWGLTAQEDFINAVACAETRLGPWQLLGFLKDLERELGRQEGERWGSRLIDLDILYYADLHLDSPDLTLPHLRLEQRSFVQIPLAELKYGLARPDQLEAAGLSIEGKFTAAECPIAIS